MADEKSSTPVVGYPTREIRITGERVALMTQNVIRVSRFEQSLVNMAMSGQVQMRDQVKKASERFNRALGLFEDELREAERELEIASNRRSQRQPRDQGRQQQSGKDNRKRNNQQTAANTPSPANTPAVKVEATKAAAQEPAVKVEATKAAAQPKQPQQSQKNQSPQNSAQTKPANQQNSNGKGKGQNQGQQPNQQGNGKGKGQQPNQQGNGEPKVAAEASVDLVAAASKTVTATVDSIPALD